MIDQYSSGPLAVPRSGVSRMVVSPEGLLSREELIAAWKTPEQGDGSNGNRTAPKRVVVRIDGYISDQHDVNGDTGFPCAMVQVIYRVGGFTREVLIDAVNQSALVVWADTIEVKTIWDRRRIERLAAFTLDDEPAPVLPCVSQDIACAISAWHDGDAGPADARWLDTISVDAATDLIEVSLHQVPNGARGVRFLNGIDSSGNPVRLANVAKSITFSSAPSGGFIESVDNGLTDQSTIAVPVCAGYLTIVFPLGTLASSIFPVWLEWIMAPGTVGIGL